jgi:hypothetical protein
LGVGVRSDVGDPVPLLNAQSLKRRRPTVTPLEELLVGQPEIIVNNGLALGIKLASPAGEIEGS